ncbi:DUF2292 domain-containing protein [bacterium]|nr:DUF2292 domain-containing protein [bacterium]
MATNPTYRIAEFLSSLEGQKYFGKVTFCFQAGKVVDIKKEENLKLSDLEMMSSNKSIVEEKKS